MIKKQIREIIAEQLGYYDPSEIELDASLYEDLDADYEDLLAILSLVEDTFDLVIDHDVADQIDTVRDLAKYVELELRHAG